MGVANPLTYTIMHASFLYKENTALQGLPALKMFCAIMAQSVMYEATDGLYCDIGIICLKSVIIFCLSLSIVICGTI